MFVVNTKDEIDGFSDAGVGFYRLLNYIAEEYDSSQALLSIVSVSIACINLLFFVCLFFHQTQHQEISKFEVLYPMHQVFLLCLVLFCGLRHY